MKSTRRETDAIKFGNTADVGRWTAMGADFAAAMKFLCRKDIKTLPLGRYELTATAYAMIQAAELKPVAGRTSFWSEMHGKHIDIQMPLDGDEVIGVADIPSRFEPFNVEKDVGFAECPVDLVTLSPGEFGVFYPNHGAHAPCLTDQSSPIARRKVVVKICAPAKSVK